MSLRILAIDGMGSPGNIWRELIVPMKEMHPDIQPTYAHWFDFNLIMTFGPFDAIWGHSLGGDTARRVCEELKKRGLPQPKILGLLGARYQTDVKPASNWDWLNPYDSAQVMIAPNDVTHNFWTHGPFCSAPCTGAVENVDVGSFFGGIWHGTIPAAPAVHNCFGAFVESQRQPA